MVFSITVPTRRELIDAYIIERVASETTEDRKRVLAASAHGFVGSFKVIIRSFIPMPRNSSSLVCFCTCADHIVLYSSSRSTAAITTQVDTLSRSPTLLSPNISERLLRPLFTHPLHTPAALLICVVRLEAAGAEMPIHHLAGHGGATSDELREQRQRFFRLGTGLRL